MFFAKGRLTIESASKGSCNDQLLGLAVPLCRFHCFAFFVVILPLVAVGLDLLKSCVILDGAFFYVRLSMIDYVETIDHPHRAHQIAQLVTQELYHVYDDAGLHYQYSIVCKGSNLRWP